MSNTCIIVSLENSKTFKDVSLLANAVSTATTNEKLSFRQELGEELEMSGNHIQSLLNFFKIWTSWMRHLSNSR